MMMSADRAPSFPTAALMPCAMPRYSVGKSSEACVRSPQTSGHPLLTFSRDLCEADKAALVRAYTWASVAHSGTGG